MTTKRAGLDWLIWSADVEDRVKLLGNLELVPDLKIIKIDRYLLELLGWELLDLLVEMGYLVFDDAKIIEIPVKMEKLAKLHVAHKPWMLNCMAGGVSNYELTGENLDGLKRFADVCNSAGVRSCGVTVLTSKKPKVVSNEFNGRTSIDQVLYYVGQLYDCGFTDIVCSPEEAEAIRSDSLFDGMDLNCPGIRMPDAPPDDQARTMTPLEAKLARVTRQVVGRPLTNGDIAANLQQIAANYNGQTA